MYDHQALTIAISYLTVETYEGWVVFKDTVLGQCIKTWPDLKAALILRFDSFKKIKYSKRQVGDMKQLRDAASFKEYFQKMPLDIPNISVDEQLDRYIRVLKP